MKNQAKTKGYNCPYCKPTDPENQCILATAKTVIDGKEYSACCSNLNKIKTKNQKKKNPEK
jgi:hypothetical protein